MSHIDQANHNEQCARFLIDDAPEYRDWAITAAFYAAVHLAEASFFTHSDIGHSATAKDRGGAEIHRYREGKIRELANSAYPSYRKLREASQHARYLARSRGSSTTHQSMMDYYGESVVRNFIEKDLPKVRDELEKAFGVNLD